MNTISFLTSSPAGDLMCMLAGIKQMCNDLKVKAVIYQHVGMVGERYPNSVSPFVNEQGLPVAMDIKMFNKLKPLMLSQKYIADFVEYRGQDYDIDLDKGRLEIFTNQPKGSAHRWIFHAYPQMVTDLSKAWIAVHNEIGFEDKLIINYTFRYRNYLIKYFFLKKYEDRILFVGMKDEYDDFRNRWDLDIPLFETDNLYDFAIALDGCKAFAGNQSFSFNLAEAMKVPRALEAFEPMPCVIPCGNNAYDYYHQGEAEYYFDKLMK